jgi:TP901 family phage tail tape measure protein
VSPIPGGKIDILVNPDFNGFEGSLRKGLSSAAGIAKTAAIGLGAAITAGTAIAAVGFKKVIDLGMQYQDNLNELQAVSGATGAQMAQISKVAVQLGNDMSLPATSAADAASAMLELTKGGLSVADSMTAAKGTLQLAAAASIDAGTAAEIQSKALNEFGLSAGDAGHVADVLANTANAAAGSITDIGYALNYVGPVAKSFGISIDDTAAALGLMANKGIQGEQAGTSLRGMLASLAQPSKQAAAALETLGVKAFDNKGKFVGLEAIIGQLAKAHGKLTQAQFEEAAAAAFGNEGLTVANALAESGTAAFDDMAKSVSKQGGAADVAGAKMKGLGGALQGLQSQAETAALGIYQAISPGLEALVRGAQGTVQDISTAFISGLNTAVALGQLYGPSIAKAISSKAAELEKAVEELLKPLVNPALGLANTAVNAVLKAYGNLVDVLHSAQQAAVPLAHGLADVVTSANQAGGPIGTAASGIGLVGNAAASASSFLIPLGAAVGGIAHLFSELPGPVQSAIVALIAYKLATRTLGDTSMFTGIRQFRDEMTKAQSVIQSTGGVARYSALPIREMAQYLEQSGTASGNAVPRLSQAGAAMAAFETSTVPTVAALRNFRDQTVAIKEGAAAAGTPISTMGAAMGTLVERVPLLSQMKGAFTSAAEGAGGFGTAVGIAAAAGTGLKGVLGGLFNAMGGLPGLIIMGAVVGLSLLAKTQQDAAQKTQQHAAAVDGLAAALRESNGAIDANVRKTQAQAIQASDNYKIFQAAGISLKDLTDISLGNVGAFGRVNGALTETAGSTKLVANGVNGVRSEMTDQAVAAQAAIGPLADLKSQYADAAQKNKDLQAAIKNGTASMSDGTPVGQKLAAAVKTLGDNSSDADSRVHALKDAIDALSGGTIDLQAAQASLNDVYRRLGGQFNDSIDKTKGYGAALLAADGSINTATQNGSDLFHGLQDISSGMADVAQKTFDTTHNLDDVKKVVADSRQHFIDFAVAAGISADAAGVLADKAGLIPDQVVIAMSTPGMATAQQELEILKGKIASVPPGKEVTVTTLSADAEAALTAFGAHVTHLPNGSVTVSASTAQAQAAVDGFIRQNDGRRVTITIVGQSTQITVGGGRQAATNALGNIIETYAAGGLRPMKGGTATIVPANTWRVIGDNVRSPEAYIPIDNSLRSSMLLSETASRMGYDLIRRFAAGGVANAGGATTAVASAVPAGARITGNLKINGLDGYIDGRIDYANVATGSAIAQRSRS